MYPGNHQAALFCLACSILSPERRQGKEKTMSSNSVLEQIYADRQDNCFSVVWYTKVQFTKINFTKQKKNPGGALLFFVIDL